MHIYDISLPITQNMLVWPGDPNIVIRQMSSIEKGNDANVSQIRMSVHTGTHIDAPRHFLNRGKSIGQIPIHKLVGKAFLMVIPDEITLINENVIKEYLKEEILGKTKKLLIRTHNSTIGLLEKSDFREDYVGLDSTAADYLAQKNLDLIGIDYLSIAAFKDIVNTHKILLQNDIILLEGINLSGIKEGFYTLQCLPLNLDNCEGAPARAILIDKIFD